VNQAEKMLNSEEALSEIAFECVFGSVSSFIRNFKKYRGSAPSDYKKFICWESKSQSALSL
jgi:AraC-like DNA-binding protein